MQIVESNYKSADQISESRHRRVGEVDLEGVKLRLKLNYLKPMLKFSD